VPSALKGVWYVQLTLCVERRIHSISLNAFCMHVHLAAIVKSCFESACKLCNGSATLCSCNQCRCTHTCCGIAYPLFVVACVIKLLREVRRAGDDRCLPGEVQKHSSNQLVARCEVALRYSVLCVRVTFRPTKTQEAFSACGEPL
jgi:hypothetical protein